MTPGPVVVAVGGNALLPDPRHPEGRGRRLERFVATVSRLPADGGLVVVHGNGPQVGALMLRDEAAADELPPEPLDVLVAETQGGMGHELARALRSASGLEVVVLVTEVVVDPTDPAFRRPTKPIGPWFDTEEGSRLAKERGWRTIVDDRGRVRRVVPSPRPVEVLDLPALRELVRPHRVVIAAGGGGAPVVRRGDGTLEGVDAVVDKDRTAALLGIELEADAFVVVTDVDAVYRDHGTAQARPIPRLGVAEAWDLARRLPEGSMGPKVEAMARFVAATGKPAIVGDADGLPAAWHGEAGTRVIAAEEVTPR